MARTVIDDRARQGPRGKAILYVLVASLVLAGIYLAGFLMWSGSQTPTSPSQAASQATTSGAASSSSTSAVPAGNPAYPAPAANTANNPR